jgi:hypothetical protein
MKTKKNKSIVSDKLSDVEKLTILGSLIDQELIDFANFFSINYKALSVGNYVSDGRKYHILYLDKLVREGDIKSMSIARVGLRSGNIEIDKPAFESKKIKSDYVFFIILWCAVCLKVSTIEQADRFAIEYYLSRGRSVKDLISGCRYSFFDYNKAHSIELDERFKYLLSAIEKNKLIR